MFTREYGPGVTGVAAKACEDATLSTYRQVSPIHGRPTKNAGFHKWGTWKWMVYNGKPYQNGWFGGTPILGNLQMVSVQEWNMMGESNGLATR